MGHAEEHGGGRVLAYNTDRRCSSQWILRVGFLVTLPSLYLLGLSASSGRLFTAVMPMVAAGLILDDPTLQPVRRLVSLVGTVCVWGFVFVFLFCCASRMAVVAAASLSLLATSAAWPSPACWHLEWVWGVIATVALDLHECSRECHR